MHIVVLLCDSMLCDDDVSFDVTFISLIELPIEDVGASFKQQNNLPVVNFNDATKNSNDYRLSLSKQPELLFLSVFSFQLPACIRISIRFSAIHFLQSLVLMFV